MPRQAGHQEDPVDASLILAKFDPELLVLLAETLGNPLVLLISNAHLSKAFCEAARNAQGLFKHAELRLRADDAAVASVVSKCPQLSSLDLRYCRTITDVALRAVASSCPQLSSLSLGYCNKIADAAVAAVAKGCPKLSSLDLGCCDMITDGAVVTVASGCPQLSSLHLESCHNIGAGYRPSAHWAHAGSLFHSASSVTRWVVGSIGLVAAMALAVSTRLVF